MSRKPAHEQFDTLQAIRDRAFELFGRYGYEGVSIGDIAKAARLSKGALYWHYRGKDELYLECLQRLHAIFDEHVFDPMRAETRALPKILSLFQGLGRLLQDPRVVHGVAGYWLIPARPETVALTGAQAAFEQRARSAIEEALRVGAEQGHFDYKGDLEEMARAIISLVEAVVLPLRFQASDEVHRILGVLARTLFRAYAKSEELIAYTRGI